MSENDPLRRRLSSSCKLPDTAVRPMISVPSKSSMDNLFGNGLGESPGTMTLVSSFFPENDPDTDYRTFSQLLSGGIPSTAPLSSNWPSFAPPPRHVREMGIDQESRESNSRRLEFGFQQQSGMVTIPPGLSPSCLLDSPVLFPSGQGLLGMPNQQVLAHITSQVQDQSLYSSLSTSSSSSTLLYLRPSIQQPMPSFPNLTNKEDSINASLSDQKPHPCNFPVDKPSDDGFNWRKYGQKQVKGSEFPRSYYKCTHQSCPVKKKVERSFDGQITEIIYKGQHNHPPPIKHAKDSGNQNSDDVKESNKLKEGVLSLSCTKDHELDGSSDSDEMGDTEAKVHGRDADEPEFKRRNIEGQSSELGTSHRLVTEPRIIVQATSEVDLLDDGYRWRKYGQKVVKGNQHPRSYYKCTNPGCNVRKHIERSASEPKAVITTYEGKHTHDVPAAKTSSHQTASQLRPHNSILNKPMTNGRLEFRNNEQPPLGLLRFKEEQIT